MSEIPLDEAPGAVSDAAHGAARGQVVYLTEHGQRLAAIVPAELAAELEDLSPEAVRELMEDFADGHVAREALTELAAGARPIAAADVWAELGLVAEAEIEEPEAEMEGPPGGTPWSSPRRRCERCGRSTGPWSSRSGRQPRRCGDEPRPAGVKMLTGMHGVLRIRLAGDYRVLYTVEDDRLVVLIVDVGHRRQIYR